MIHFAHPILLDLLLLIPLSVALYIVGRILRKRRLEKFGHIGFFKDMMPDTSKYMPNVKITLELTAVALIIVALARPYTQKVSPQNEKTEETASGIELMICVDVSNSMLASSTERENGVSRLQRTKFILEKLLDKLSDDKVGLIVFAGEAYTQLPITSDFISAKMFMNRISTESVATQGTAIGAAIDMANNSFSEESDFEKAILLITDAENFEDNAVEAAKAAKNAGIHVNVIGVGGSTPMPVPMSENGTDFFMDENGEPAKTQMNVENGEAIAKAGGGIFVEADDDDVVGEIVKQLSELSKTDYKRRLASNSVNELFPIAVWLALFLLLIDQLLPYSKIEWLTRFNFFTKKEKK